MSLAEILEQVKALSQQERDELIDHLSQMQTENIATTKQSKTGSEIAAMLEAMDRTQLNLWTHISKTRLSGSRRNAKKKRTD